MIHFTSFESVHLYDGVKEKMYWLDVLVSRLLKGTPMFQKWFSLLASSR